MGRPIPQEELIAAVALIERGQTTEALATLHECLGRGARYYFIHAQVPDEHVEDLVQDLFVTVVENIQAGELRAPEALVGYIRTIARRRVAQWIEKTIAERKTVRVEDLHDVIVDQDSPHKTLLIKERAQLIQDALRKMPWNLREMLRRAYLEGETREQICAEMHITPTQYRLWKSRAKAEIAHMIQSKERFTALRLKAFHGKLAA